ncbi:MAG: hypothetical protein M3Z82_03340 [Apilactobacillus sp.]|nr:hypothetical protein [Apilactobacillus sp.]
MEKMNLSLMFIKTKDNFYFISGFSDSSMYQGSIGYFIKSTDQMFMLNTSDNFDNDYIKAFRIKTKDILAYGRYETLKAYSEEEINDIKSKGKLNDQPIYEVIK